MPDDLSELDDEVAERIRLARGRRTPGGTTLPYVDSIRITFSFRPYCPTVWEHLLEDEEQT